MRIGVVASMHFVDRMVEVREKLKAMGHDAFMTEKHEPMLGKNGDEIERIKLEQRREMDAIRAFWKRMQDADAILVLNFDKKGVKNYVGGNTLMEIGFAYVLKQKIFMWNPIPETLNYKEEIEAVKPIIIYGDLSKIK